MPLKKITEDLLTLIFRLESAMKPLSNYTVIKPDGTQARINVNNMNLLLASIRTALQELNEAIENSESAHYDNQEGREDFQAKYEKLKTTHGLALTHLTMFVNFFEQEFPDFDYRDCFRESGKNSATTPENTDPHMISLDERKERLPDGRIIPEKRTRIVALYDSRRGILRVIYVCLFQGHNKENAYYFSNCLKPEIKTEFESDMMLKFDPKRFIYFKVFGVDRESKQYERDWAIQRDQPWPVDKVSSATILKNNRLLKKILLTKKQTPERDLDEIVEDIKKEFADSPLPLGPGQGAHEATSQHITKFQRLESENQETTNPKTMCESGLFRFEIEEDFPPLPNGNLQVQLIDFTQIPDPKHSFLKNGLVALYSVKTQKYCVLMAAFELQDRVKFVPIRNIHPDVKQNKKAYINTDEFLILSLKVVKIETKIFSQLYTQPSDKYQIDAEQKYDIKEKLQETYQLFGQDVQRGLFATARDVIGDEKFLTAIPSNLLKQKK